MLKLNVLIQEIVHHHQQQVIQHEFMMNIFPIVVYLDQLIQ